MVQRFAKHLHLQDTNSDLSFRAIQIDFLASLLMARTLKLAYAVYGGKLAKRATKITGKWLRSSFKSPRCQHTLVANRILGDDHLDDRHSLAKETRFDFRGQEALEQHTRIQHRGNISLIFVEPTMNFESRRQIGSKLSNSHSMVTRSSIWKTLT